MSLTASDLQALLAAFDASAWDEMRLSLAGEQVQLSKTGRPPAGSEIAGAGGRSAAAEPGDLPAPPLAGVDAARLPPPVEEGAVGAPAEVASVAAVEAAERRSEALLENTTGTHRVTAPSVGLFWRAPDPSAPPFVEIGQRVEPDDPVCIVEVMKLFNHVQAGVTGTVRSVEIENGAMVEHGQALFVIEKEA
ncbi:MAG: biotin/lipoyl-containing protein [Mycobacteriales bacterium]